jgi:hypothetical protein
MCKSVFIYDVFESDVIYFCGEICDVTCCVTYGEICDDGVSYDDVYADHLLVLRLHCIHDPLRDPFDDPFHDLGFDCMVVVSFLLYAFFCDVHLVVLHLHFDQILKHVAFFEAVLVPVFASALVVIVLAFFCLNTYILTKEINI